MWAALANVALGIWLMAAPAVLGYGGQAMDNDRIVGPFIATFSCVALWEATRSVRLWNLPLAAWLLVAAFALDYPGGAFWNALAVGAAVGALSCFRCEVRGRYGGGWAALFR